MNITTGILAVILVATVVNWQSKLNISAGGVGVSLVIIIGLSETLGRLIREWTKLESSIGAVARVKRFVAETEQEDDASVQESVSAHEWILSGSIEFRDVVASFRFVFLGFGLKLGDFTDASWVSLGPGPTRYLKGYLYLCSRVIIWLFVVVLEVARHL